MVHVGVVIIFIGYTGTAFDRDITKEVAPGGSTDVGHYHLRIADIQSGGQRHVRLAEATAVDVSRNGSALSALSQAPSLQGQSAADLGGALFGDA